VQAGGRSKGTVTDEWLTVDEVCQIIKIGRRTFERYLSRGTGPRIKRLAGNGSIRIRRDWLDEWMDDAV
jgi:excisionase family DNA binding protein